MSARWRRLVQQGFELLYHQMAWSYDAVSWLASLGQWRAWQRAGLPYVHGIQVLELAHGPGHMLLALRRAGYNVTGLDLSPQMGRMAHRRVARAGAYVPLVRGRGEALPFAAGSFDTVYVTFPTPFILAGETLHSLWRVLHPGGRAVIVPQAHLTGRGVAARFVNWLYVITGQRQDAAPSRQIVLAEPWVERVRRHGFSLEVVAVNLLRSEVLVVIAHRPPSAGGEAPA
jgi:ubiquinone/menaquinone biosynthesis C-methylase UbiE